MARQPGDVQVSVDHLTFLINSIETLRKEVAQLRQERTEDKKNIIFLRKELESLKPPQGRVFTLFPKLPKEIRLMIWDIILWTPQVIGVRQYFKAQGTLEETQMILSPTGPHTLLRRVNKEARNQAKKINTCSSLCINHISRGLFANPEIDTFWIIDFDHISPANPQGMKFPWEHNHQIRKLAIPFDAFKHEFMEDDEDMIGRFGMNMLTFLWKHGVQELIVIFQGDAAAYHTDVVFVTPTASPFKYFAKEGLEESIQDTKDIDWAYTEHRCWRPTIDLLDRHAEALDGKLLPPIYYA